MMEIQSHGSSQDFVSHFRQLALLKTGETALVVVAERDGKVVDTGFTYQELDQRVRALAAQLQSLAKGSRVLLMLDNDEHYVVAFLACLYAGMIAVPVFPPESQRQQHLARLIGVTSDAQVSCILATTAVLSTLGTSIKDFGIARVVAVDAVDVSSADRWIPHTPAANDIAFLQYTSGSTSAPKGVQVSHANLMANERAIESSLAISDTDIFASWLPLYHDMGLIGGLLQPLYRGVKVILMTPAFFLERPLRWLEAISRHRATVSGGPDFAYRLCLERIRESQLPGLDLSSWRLAFSGAEPVRHETLTAFAERFAPAGFRAHAVYPCYGLAEATLLVTAGRSGRGPVITAFQTGELARGHAIAATDAAVAGRQLVSCGTIATGHALSIRDSTSLVELKSGHIGEIWVSGPSIAQGYWNNPQPTAETFVEMDGTRWLRTGDLGFEHAGELYVAGRMKDLIIIRGHNLYPQDLEQHIEAEVEAIRKGRVAAFAVTTENGEGIGIAAEISRSMQKLVSPTALVELLSSVIGEVSGEPATVVVLLNPGALPKTSSGKLQRRACRAGWQAGTLDAYAVYEQGGFTLGGGDTAQPQMAIVDECERQLATLWEAALPATAHLDVDAHFFARGGNSLAAVQVALAIANHWNIEFPAKCLFEYPRLRACAAEIKRRLERGSKTTAIQLIASELDYKNPLPVSFAQQRQWFLWQLDRESTAYHIQAAVRFTGDLNQEALAAALTELVKRHDSLCSRFQLNAAGELEHYVDEGKPPLLEVIDLRCQGNTKMSVAEELRRINSQPYDLTAGALARFTLVRATDTASVLALSMHHIIADGVSIQVLMNELATGYSAALTGTRPGYAPIAIRYADYARWQRAWLATPEKEQQLTYWQTQLGDEHPVLALPTDNPRPAIARYSARQHAIQLPGELVNGLRVLGVRQDASLFMVLLAGFQVLLHRYTGQEDIRVGVPVANRPMAEIQGIVGFFVNTLVLRNVLTGTTRLTDTLTQVRQATLHGQANQDLPFEQLVEALHPSRSLSHSPLFQVLFNYLHEDYHAWNDVPGVIVSRELTEPGAAQFELTVEIREQAKDSVEVYWLYAAELFEEQTILQMATHYVRVLEAFTTCAELAIRELPLLDGNETALLGRWGNNDNPQGQLLYPSHSLPSQSLPSQPHPFINGLVHQGFEAQVLQQPDAEAVCFGNEKLTYGALNTRANQLAHYLIGLGVKPEATVGIAMERSLDMVVGLLGIMKAGGAYVPIDPEYPQDRITYMLEDSGVGLVLTQQHLRGLLPAGSASKVLAVDGLNLDNQPGTNPDVLLHGDNLVYVIYTSGSTGRPKGAANQHRSLCNRLAWGQQHSPLVATDTVLQKTPFSFDISFWEFFWPLTTGARLALAGPGDHRDPARLAALIHAHQITCIHFVPSMLQAFLASGQSEGCGQIRKILCSGEALSAELQNQTLGAFPTSSLLNLYGPTEAAIEVTYWDCLTGNASSVPIGRPIAGLRALVLDANLNPVPRGVAGELYLGGIGLARGYWQRPGLSAERFVADPSSTTGERLYRSGDLVCWNRAGQIEYLGRVDHQVKIRGFRIELGEIEAQLLALADVREAVVVASSDAGGARLIAYVSPVFEGQNPVPLDPVQIRASLGANLPDYMVPSVIMVLDTMPLNANGKLDRKALPVPQLASRTAYEAPEGELAQTIAAVWAEVLGIEKPGIQDNFFDLGGHSLQLLSVHRLLQERLDTSLSVIDLFKHPTINALAAAYSEAATDGAATANEISNDTDRAQRRRAAQGRRARLVEGVE